MPRELLRSSKAAFILAWMAILLRAAMPAGYMTAPAASGGLQIVLCSGEGPLVLGSAPTGHIPDDGHQGGTADHHPCAFSGAGAALASVEPVAEAPVRWPAAPPVATFAAEIRPGRGLAAPPPPSTGPPLQI